MLVRMIVSSALLGFSPEASVQCRVGYQVRVDGATSRKAFSIHLLAGFLPDWWSRTLGPIGHGGSSPTAGCRISNEDVATVEVVDHGVLEQPVQRGDEPLAVVFAAVYGHDAQRLVIHLESFALTFIDRVECSVIICRFDCLRTG